MNKLTKAGVSALCGSLAVVVSANAGDMAVTGGVDMTWMNVEDGQTGNAIGVGSNLTFKGNGELDNGATFAVTVGHLNKNGYSNANVVVTWPGIGDIRVDQGASGTGIDRMDDMTPTAWEEAYGHGIASGVQTVGGVAHSANIEWISIMFMIIGSLPFVVYLKMIHGDWKSIYKDDQIKLFFILIFILIVFTTAWFIIKYQENYFFSLRVVSFNIISILTGTGYSSSNFSLWGGFGIVIMFIIMFIGGCAGSTTGGVKIFRLQLLFRAAQTQIKKLTQPHGVFITSFNQKSVPESTFNSIMGFFFMYILIFVLAAIILSFLGLDFLTALSASASAISNVGPGLGNIIGPTGNYSIISMEAKWVLSFTRLVGRLEIFTFLVLLSLSFWKK